MNRKEEYDQAGQFFSNVVMAAGSAIIFVVVFGGLVAAIGGMWQFIKWTWGIG